MNLQSRADEVVLAICLIVAGYAVGEGLERLVGWLS
jgi:hypothetical protein